MGQRRQVLGAQRGVGPRRHGDGVFCRIGHADEGRAGGYGGAANDMGLHAGIAQRSFQRCGKSIVAECQQHARGGTASTCAGNRLVGTFSARKGFKTLPQYRFTRRRNMRRTNHEIDIR